MIAIEFRNYSSYYKVKKEYLRALAEINLAVEAGTLLVIVGESGSGKSTLINACLGLIDLYEGDLLIEGVPVEEIDLKSGKFACVRQEISLYPNKTIYENLAFPLRIMRTPQAEVDRRVKQMAEMLDISLMLTRKPRHLSGGQQQRVAIGRALIKNPAFLFFDEPFSRIDQQTRVALRELVRRIHREFSMTTVFATHDLDEAFALADRIVVLDQGRIVEEGRPEELIKSHRSDILGAYFASKAAFREASRGEGETS